MTPNILEGYIPRRLRSIQILGRKNHHPLEKHHLIEKETTPSPYLPSVALEIETFSRMYPKNNLPKDVIKKLIYVGGFNRGTDGKLDKITKDELIIDPTFGSHVTIAQEIQILVDQGFLKLNKKRHTHIKEFYPIHFNLGIAPDFPDFNLNMPGEHLSKSHWRDLRDQEDAPIHREVMGLSDCFCWRVYLRQRDGLLLKKDY